MHNVVVLMATVLVVGLFDTFLVWPLINHDTNLGLVVYYIYCAISGFIAGNFAFKAFCEF